MGTDFGGLSQGDKNSFLNSMGVKGKRAGSSHEKALSKAKKGGHKQGEREVKSKKAGFYVQGHKNYGDVYEA